MPAPIKRIKRSLGGLILALVIFIIISDALVITSVHSELIRNSDIHAQHENILFSKLVFESLSKGDYTSVESAVSQWGQEVDDIVNIKVTAANGFVLAAYIRENPAKSIRNYTDTFTYGNNRSATTHVTRDISSIREHVYELSMLVVIFSVFLAVILSYVLRYAAIKPLVEEINERQKAQLSLQKKTQELSRSNKELETFSYSVAHDLRSPLRTIASFGQILEQDCGKKLNEEEQGHLGRIIKAAQHMAKLIDDLLDLARISQTTMLNQPVNLSEIAEDFLELQKKAAPQRKIDYTITPGLIVNGDPRLLKMLMENLLSNAWKYTSKNERTHIEFGSMRKNTQLVHYIRDNGIGFNMDFADKLFQPFQRLDNSPDFDGSGIGLTNVKWIIDRHGGTVWANAEYQHGATFYFTLPQAVESRAIH